MMSRGFVVLGVCLVATTAFAGDKVAAEAAFRQGKALMKAQNYTEACAAFEKSQSLDPQFGTEYNLANCYEKAGRLASAWGEFRELAQRDSNAARRSDSAKHAAALTPRLIRLAIRVSAHVDGLKLTRDGADITQTVGIESPVDPGDYQIAAAAAGYRPWSTQISAKQEGKSVEVVVPALEKLPEPPAPPKVAQPVNAPDGGAATRLGITAPRGPERSNRKLIAYITGGAGIALAGTGLYFGVRARSKWNDAKAACGGDTDHCTAAGTALDDARDLRSTARSAGNISTVLVGAGAAAIVAGVVLYVTAPSSHAREHAALEVIPSVTPDGFAVAAGGRF